MTQSGERFSQKASPPFLGLSLQIGGTVLLLKLCESRVAKVTARDLGSVAKSVTSRKVM